MKNTIKWVCIITLTMVIIFSMAGCVTVRSVLPFPQTGEWSVAYKDLTGDITAKMVIERVNGDTFSGYFDWYWDDNEYMGREAFTGTYVSKVNTITINGNAITEVGVERPGYVIVTGKYQGTIDRFTLNIEGERNSWNAEKKKK